MPIIHGQEYSTRYNAFDRWSHSIQANEDEDTAPQILFIPSALHSGCAVARYAIPLMPETASAPESQETSHFAEEYSMDTERPGPGRAVAHTSSAADTQAAPGVIARYPPPQVADACDDNFALSWPGLAAAVETLSGVAIGLPTNHAWRTYTGASIQFGARRADGVVCPVSLLDCQLMRVALHDGEKEPSCLSAVTDGRFRFQISVGRSFRMWLLSMTDAVRIDSGLGTRASSGKHRSLTSGGG
ncbi:hypothetical protein HYPSUDRAFT_769105 [Hypholoma sublateritium FD-334 SS-4]|uniref:Uncharacterized protein n=1 Tax=Hypholoma sublateritium (strain FD-334 SS-4) TaxID=945553 RepID=A0A0D2NQ29_HYPSF|nr:hypothetical protein HYPSUDRAFT_769105 [Hypholoma sublateritium FD-334 SS-4]